MIFIVVFSLTLGILLEDSVIIYSNIVVASVVTDPVIIGIQTRKGIGVPVWVMTNSASLYYPSNVCNEGLNILTSFIIILLLLNTACLVFGLYSYERFR